MDQPSKFEYRSPSPEPMGNHPDEKSRLAAEHTKLVQIITELRLERIQAVDCTEEQKQEFAEIVKEHAELMLETEALKRAIAASNQKDGGAQSEELSST